MARFVGWWFDAKGKLREGEMGVEISHANGRSHFEVLAFGDGDVVWRNGTFEGTFTTTKGDVLDLCGVRDPDSAIHFTMCDKDGMVVSDGKVVE